MNPPDITTLLNMTDSDALDFKSAQYRFWKPTTDEDKSELLKDIVAFANSFKTGDAFIVIGVSERNQRRDQVVGVSTHLQDSEVQQFVNSKTNRRVDFLVHAATAEGQPVDIVQIAQRQQRPIFLTKNFGRVKANDVWIRVGSSSAIATPDHIAAMVDADQKARLGEARIAMEWAEPKARTRLGVEAILTGTRLVDPPRPPPSPEVTPPTDLQKRIAGLGDFQHLRDLLAVQQRMWRNLGIVSENGPTDDPLRTYAQARALYSPLGIWLKNLGTRNASNVNVRIAIPKLNGVMVADVRTLPRAPSRHRTLLGSDWLAGIGSGTSVEETANTWNIQISARTIQPQDEYWSYSPFFAASTYDRDIGVVATVYADDLARPIEVQLRIRFQVVEREMAADDLRDKPASKDEEREG